MRWIWWLATYVSCFCLFVVFVFFASVCQEDDDAEDVPKKKPKLEQQPIKGNAKPKPAAAAAAANNKTVKKSENQK